MFQRDFTLDAYAALIRVFLDEGYQCVRVRDVVHAPESVNKPYVILRHDVDRWPGRALAIAVVESELGVHSTFYMRPSKSTFVSGVVRAIAALGHEVGYHYETLSLSGGNVQSAVALFHEELGRLRELAPVETCAMHGSPLSPHNNLDIWKSMTLDDAGLLAEAFQYFEKVPEVLYISDTGRSWGNRNNIRDRISGHMVDQLTDTASLIAFLRSEHPPAVYLASHPERWLSHPLKWAVQWGFDTLANIVKRLVWIARGRPG